eukprot:jgi/Tetstr1/421739/TSEL_001198.t1
MYKKHGNVRNYLARHYFQDEGKDGQGLRKNSAAWWACWRNNSQRAGGIIKHNTNAVKNMAATQAVPRDVDEGSSPEPPAKKAKQPAKPAAGGLARGRGGAGAKAGGGALGSRAGRRAAVAAAATRERHAGRRGGPGQNRM